MPGLIELKQELERDYSSFKIKDLCIVDGEDVKMICFRAARPLDVFASHFTIMMSKQSNLFLRPLNKRLKEFVTSDTELTIASISDDVWKPTFDDCRKLLDSLSDKTIKLKEVDRHFKPFADQLETQVSNLAAGIGECLQVRPQKKTELAVLCIRDYWKLCEYRDGADIFLKLREVLKLQGGDFKDVERFSTKVTVSNLNSALKLSSLQLSDMTASACFL